MAAVANSAMGGYGLRPIDRPKGSLSMSVRSGLAHLALVLFGTVLALVLLEVMLRVFQPFEYRIKGDQIVLPINRLYEVKVNAGTGLEPFVRHTKNSLGFRGPEFPARPNDFLKLIAVGGSTTECFYLSDGETWPELFGDLAQRVVQPVWVNNAGLDGHSTFGHRILLDEVLKPLHPDVVLFLVGWNDLGRTGLGKSDRNQLRSGQGGSTFRDRMIWLANNTEVAGLALNLYRTWKTRRMGLGHDATFFDWEHPPEGKSVPPERADTILAEHGRLFAPSYAERLRTLVNSALDAGIKPVLITQPAVFGGGRDPRTGADLDRIAGRYGDGAQTWRVLELYNDMARDVAETTGARLVDLARLMPKDSTYFYDEVHFNNAGAKKAAEILFGQLCPWLLETYPDRATGSCPTP